MGPMENQLWMLRNQLAMLIHHLVNPVSNKRNRAFWKNGALWVSLSLHLVAEGKSDAKFFI